MPFELIVIVVLDVEFGAIAFYFEKPWFAGLIKLESKLEQFAKLIERNFLFSRDLFCLRLHEDQNDDDFLTEATPELLFLLVHGLYARLLSSVKELDQIVYSISAQCWSKSEARRFERILTVVVVFMSKSQFDVVEDVRSHCFEVLNEDID